MKKSASTRGMKEKERESQLAMIYDRTFTFIMGLSFSNCFLQLSGRKSKRLDNGPGIRFDSVLFLQEEGMEM